MNLSRHAPAPTRYVGIGLVVALHLAGIYALSAGLIKPPQRVAEPTTFRPLPPDPPKSLPEPRPVLADAPKLDTPRLITVPVPDIIIADPIADPSAQVTTTTHKVEAPTGPTGPARPETPSLPAVQPRITAPGAVCSVMPRPDVPVVAWSGEAVLNVVATVRGGRVVGSEVRVTQGALDSKTRRSLQRAVETALAGYQCQGDAMFQQDFAFRLD
jgi:hypothetical protein